MIASCKPNGKVGVVVPPGVLYREGAEKKNKYVYDQFRVYGTGTSVYGISKGNLPKIELIIPTEDEQEKIAEILEMIEENVETLEAEITKLNHLKKGLLQKLLTGKIRVKG